MTVKQATKMAFDEMPEQFHILQLCRRVKEITRRPHLMDGTITRKFRQLKEEGTIVYRNYDRKYACYSKNDQLIMNLK